MGHCSTQCYPQCMGECITQCFTQCLGERYTQCYPQCLGECFTQLSAFALNSGASSEKIRREVRKNTGKCPEFLVRPSSESDAQHVEPDSDNLGPPMRLGT